VHSYMPRLLIPNSCLQIPQFTAPVQPTVCSALWGPRHGCLVLRHKRSLPSREGHDPLHSTTHMGQTTLTLLLARGQLSSGSSICVLSCAMPPPPGNSQAPATLGAGGVSLGTPRAAHDTTQATQMLLYPPGVLCWAKSSVFDHSYCGCYGG
jgi:hypothetical protein